jgi:dienelactone hydrolase
LSLLVYRAVFDLIFHVKHKTNIGGINMFKKNLHHYQRKICQMSLLVFLGLYLSILNFSSVNKDCYLKTAETKLQVIIDPADQIFGTAFSLKVKGLRPGEKAVLKASSLDSKRREWTSRAVFQADEKGNIDIALQAPLEGDYTQADILGLLWTMKPEIATGNRIPSYSYDEQNGLTVEFKITDSNGKSTSAKLRRYFQMPGSSLIRVPLEEDGLYGFMYHPVSDSPLPGVVILGGSGGGLYPWLAQAFASKGFAALTLAYFNYRDLPAELVEIPLEYFQKALTWMKSQKAIKSDSIGLVGGSKGGELALLLASVYRDLKAVVAWVPSGYVWQGISNDMSAVSSWSKNSQGLPFIKGIVTPEDIAKYEKGEIDSVRSFYTLGLEKADPETIERATIPVEKIQAPILLVSGTDDQTWPSAEFCHTIMQRLKRFQYPYEYKHICCENGGHQVFLPSLVTGPNRSMKGGTAKDEAHGSLISWGETFAFLSRHLQR